ncbi:MAG: recombination protein RecR [Deltaproteobacteria bacterium]|nr:MAG: recombination protein RecR [Deltaproteobacteria bacterium]TMB16283.1 MAG: recombination protein RecR [Deltaproteobacteria bacterium]
MARLVQQLSRLPGIGEKTAGRLAFWILRADREYAQALAEAIISMKDETRLCSVCFALTEADPCPICTDPQRSAETICVVEEPPDLLAVERARGFRGRYHVLHGTLAPLDGVGPDELKIQPLLTRLRDGAVREVILATNPNAEGEATALYLAKLIKPLGLRVTRIAHGVPVGGDLEYVDVMTVGRALEGRREM